MTHKYESCPNQHTTLNRGIAEGKASVSIPNNSAFKFVH